MKSKILPFSRAIITALALIFGLSNSFATVFYVDELYGDDNSGDGSVFYPYKTINTALSNAFEGDNIYLMSDVTVTQTIFVDKSVTFFGNYFKVYEGVDPVFSISGSPTVNFEFLDFYNSTATAIYASSFTGSLDVQFCNFHGGGTYAVITDESDYFFSAYYNKLYDASIMVKNGIVYNNTFTDFTYEAIYITDGTTSDVYNNIFYNVAVNPITCLDYSIVSYNNFSSCPTNESYFTLNNNFTDLPNFNVDLAPTNPVFSTSGYGGTFVGAVEPKVTQDCNSDFYYSTEGLTVSFTNYSSTGIDYTYLWKFGDGDTSTLENPDSHMYSKMGNYKVTLTVTNSKIQCSNTYEATITVGEVPLNINYNIRVDDASKTVYLTNQSSGQTWVYWYVYDYENYYPDYSSYDDTFSFNYTEPGYYYVSLQIGNDIASDYKYTILAVGDVSKFVKADYYYNYLTDDYQTVQFTDASRGTIESYSWSFGDGTYDSGDTVNKVYKNPGVYDVCLTVKNSSGDMSKYCEKIWAGYADCNLKAGFTFRKDTTGNKVKFTNTSTGDYDYIYWDFGDDAISEDSAVEHTYDANGYYWVYMMIYNTITGCYDEHYEYIQIGELDCRADFTYDVDAANLKVTLLNKSKSGNNMQLWYFDDGDYSEETNPVKPFDYGGVHYIGLMVWSDEDYTCMDYTEKEVQVGEINCSAKFTYIVDVTNNSVSCKNQAIGDNVQYEWYFGDGSYAYDKSPSHEFPAAGYYTIGLYTYDTDNWCMDYYEEVVLVGKPGIDCEADFSYLVDNANKKVTFKDKSKGKPVAYVWNFGEYSVDGLPKTSTDKDPKDVVYNKAGYYNVCLNIINEKNITNLTCKEIGVGITDSTKCNAKFVVTKKDKTAYFTDKSIGNPTEYIWDFGDGKPLLTSKDASYTYTYADNEYYLVKLSIKTAEGCESSAYEMVNIGMPDTLVTRFGYEGKDYDKKAGGYPVDFVGAGSGDQARLRWNYGDSTGLDSTSMSPTHVYTTPGTYHVCVTSEDPVTGAKSEYCQDISTAPTYIPDLNESFGYLKLYPNPVVDKIKVNYETKESGNITFSLIDVSGRKIMDLGSYYRSNGNYFENFDIKAIVPGNYFLKVDTKNGSFKKALIKK